MRVHVMTGHLHMGAHNITLYRGGVPDPARAIGTSTASYGTEPGVIGNEKGFIVGMTDVNFRDKGGLVLKKGEQYTIEAIYNAGARDPRLLGAGFHDGVMAFVILYGERCISDGCADELEPVQLGAY